MKDPTMLRHMHKLWGNKKPRAILYNCFEWVMRQKQQDRLCGGLDFTQHSFLGGARCIEGPLWCCGTRSKWNSEEQTALNIVMIIILSVTPVQAATAWLPPSGTPRRHYRKKPGQGGGDVPHRPARRWRDHLSAALLSVNSLSPTIWSSDLRAQQPLQQARQTQRNQHQLWSPRSRGSTRGEACARHHTHTETFCHGHTDGGFHPNTRAPRLIFRHSTRHTWVSILVSVPVQQ